MTAKFSIRRTVGHLNGIHFEVWANIYSVVKTLHRTWFGEKKKKICRNFFGKNVSTNARNRFDFWMSKVERSTKKWEFLMIQCSIAQCDEMHVSVCLSAVARHTLQNSHIRTSTSPPYSERAIKLNAIIIPHTAAYVWTQCRSAVSNIAMIMKRIIKCK